MKLSDNGSVQQAAGGRLVKDRILPRLLSPVPIPLFHAMLGASLVLPYYHMVSDEEVPHVKHLYLHRDIQQFTRDLDFFLAHYEPVALKDLLANLDGKGPLPKRGFLLTFDDGFREMHDVVAPILQAKGVPAMFFLTTGFIDNADMAHHCKLSLLLEHFAEVPSVSVKAEAQKILDANRVEGDSFKTQMVSVRYAQKHLVTELAALCGYDFGQYLSSRKPYLTSEQIHSLLKQGFTIGAHSVDHPLYADLPLAEQVRQTRESMQLLVERFQIDYRAFAFPHSDAGVPPEFFKELFQHRQLVVSFGTRGMVKHPFTRNLERFTMEKTSLPARQIVAKQYGRGLYRRLAG